MDAGHDFHLLHLGQPSAVFRWQAGLGSCGVHCAFVCPCQQERELTASQQVVQGEERRQRPIAGGAWLWGVPERDAALPSMSTSRLQSAGSGHITIYNPTVLPSTAGAPCSSADRCTRQPAAALPRVGCCQQAPQLDG